MTLLLAVACRTVLLPDAPTPRGDPSDSWESVLAQVVTDDGYVDYDLLEERRDVLDTYVAWIAREKRAVKVNFVRHAFWLNAYNALALYQVLERGRPESVLDVDGWLPGQGSGFFYETAFKVGFERLSLWEIQDERLRMRTLDPRDHGALTCAARSCPPLRGGLYKGGDLPRQLNVQMTTWVNDPERGVRVEDGVAVFNPIFDWYRNDFDFLTAGESLCRFAGKFALHPMKRELASLEQEGCPHRFYAFDWRLNDAKKPAEDPG